MPQDYPRRQQVFDELLGLYQRLLTNITTGELAGTPAEILPSVIIEAYVLGLDHATGRDLDDPRDVVRFFLKNFRTLLKRQKKLETADRLGKGVATP